MRKLVLASAVLPLLAAGSAMAADMPTRTPTYKAPPPVAVFSWTGCYIGGHGGYARAQANHGVSFDDANESPEFFFTNNFSPSSGVYGFQGGCNYQSGRYVFGIEGDYSWTNASQSFAFAEPAANGGDTAAFNIKLQSLASVRGRVGIADDRALLYVIAGAAWARFNYSYVLFDSDEGTNAASLSFSPNGLVFGAGAEYALTDWLILRGEYLHYTFGDDYSLPPSANPAIGPAAQDHVSLRTVDVLRVGASYKFGW
jgi:outer membrane immunogenic protein